MNRYRFVLPTLDYWRLLAQHDQFSTINAVADAGFFVPALSFNDNRARTRTATRFPVPTVYWLDKLTAMRNPVKASRPAGIPVLRLAVREAAAS